MTTYCNSTEKLYFFYSTTQKGRGGMENNRFAKLLRGPASNALDRVNCIMQKVMIASYADIDVAVEDIMLTLSEMQSQSRDVVVQRMLRLRAGNFHSVEQDPSEVTKEDVRKYIDSRLKADTVGVQVRQIEQASRNLEFYNRVENRNLQLLGDLSSKMTKFIREMNEITDDIDKISDVRLAEDVERLNAAPPRPPLPGPAVVNPVVAAGEEEGEDHGDEAMEAAGNEEEIEARELAAAGAAAPGVQIEQPQTEEQRKEEWVAKKKERIDGISHAIKQLEMIQKFVSRGKRENMLIVKGKKDVFK
jgi:hypothetical protein